MASSSTNQIVSLIGRQGSGKTTIGRELQERLHTQRIEVSEVVKTAHKEVPDLDLAKTGVLTKKDPDWLGRLVEECIRLVLSNEKGKSIVLTGAREPQVIDYLSKQGFLVYSVALHADPHTRYRRLIRQGRVVNMKEFLDREIAEWNLGLRDLFHQAPIAIPTSNDTNQAVIAVDIIARLKAKGAKLT